MNLSSTREQQLTSSERESELATENARLKRLLAERDEELAILQKAAVDSIGQRNSHVKTWGCGGFLNETDIYSKGKSICF
jgi:transposase